MVHHTSVLVYLNSLEKNCGYTVMQHKFDKFLQFLYLSISSIHILLRNIWGNVNKRKAHESLLRSLEMHCQVSKFEPFYQVSFKLMEFLAKNLKTPSTLLQDHQSCTTDIPGISTSLDFLYAPWKLTNVFQFASNLKQINQIWFRNYFPFPKCVDIF